MKLEVLHVNILLILWVFLENVAGSAKRWASTFATRLVPCTTVELMAIRGPKQNVLCLATVMGGYFWVSIQYQCYGWRTLYHWPLLGGSQAHRRGPYAALLRPRVPNTNHVCCCDLCRRARGTSARYPLGWCRRVLPPRHDVHSRLQHKVWDTSPFFSRCWLGTKSARSKIQGQGDTQKCLWRCKPKTLAWQGQQTRGHPLERVKLCSCSLEGCGARLKFSPSFLSQALTWLLEAILYKEWMPLSNSRLYGHRCQSTSFISLRSVFAEAHEGSSAWSNHFFTCKANHHPVLLFRAQRLRTAQWIIILDASPPPTWLTSLCFISLQLKPQNLNLSQFFFFFCFRDVSLKEKMAPTNKFV